MDSEKIERGMKMAHSIRERLREARELRRGGWDDLGKCLGMYAGLGERIRRPEVRKRLLADMAAAALVSGVLAWTCLGHEGGLDLYMTTVLPMLGIALVLFLVTEAWGSSRGFAMALVVLILTGTAVQVLVRLSARDAAEEVRQILLHHGVGLVCAVMALPVLHWILALPRRTAIAALKLLVLALSQVLLLMGYQGAWISLGGLSFKLTEIIGLVSLLAMGLIFTDAERTPSQRLWSAVGLLVMDGVFLFLFNELETLFVLGVVFVVLALVFRCPGRKLVLLLVAVVLAAVLVLSLCGWCYDIRYQARFDESVGALADHDLVRLGARFHSKLTLRLEAMLDPDSLSTRYEGYQYRKVHECLMLTGWFGSEAEVYVPAMTTDYIFCGLLLKLGLGAGAAVMLMLLWMLFAGIQGCVGSADPVEGAVAMAFLFAVLLRALLAAAIATDLFLPASVAFPFLSEGGSAMLMNDVMMLFVIHAIRAKTARMAGEPVLLRKERCDEGRPT